jgi:pSer/pThr/pTyr-binding forkhead associated (FHA) protein
MAISRDSRQYNTPITACFNSLLALLPMLHVRVEPLTAAGLAIEEQDSKRGEIKLRTQPLAANPTVLAANPNPPQYRYKFNLEAVGEDKCLIKAEATTSGVTDVGLGQLTLRQVLITLSLSLSGKLPSGSLPIFFVELPLPPYNSPQAQYYERVNRGFELAKRGQADVALKEWEAATFINPSGIETFFHRGVLQLLLEQMPEARRDFEQAVRVDPQHLLAGLYLEDTQARINKKVVQEQAQQKTLGREKDDSPTRKPGTGSYVPGSGVTPGAGFSPINEEQLPTQVLKRAMNGRLLLRGSGAPVAEFELKKAVTTLGRQEDNDLMLLDAKISRHHAQILTVGIGTILVDLGSVNGTFLNGQRLNLGEKVQLYGGDRIMFGNIEITFITPNPATRPVVAPPPPVPTYTPQVSPQERLWAMGVLGLNPGIISNQYQVETQFELVRRYWEQRLREAPTPQLRYEAEQRMGEVLRAREMLR